MDEQIVITEQPVMGHEAAQPFEKLLWFELGKLIWKDHRQVYYNHIKYLQQHICKPFKWTKIQYISRVREMFDYCIYLQPSTMKGQNWEKADWKARNMPAPEKSIREAIKDGLLQAMQDKILEKDDYYRLSSEEDFNDILTNLELSDERDRATIKIAEEEIKRIRAEMREKHVLDNGVSSNKRRKISTNGRGITRRCSLCKNAGIPERKFMSHLDSQCQDKVEMAKRAMSGSVADQSKQIKKSDLFILLYFHTKIFLDTTIIGKQVLVLIALVWIIRVDARSLKFLDNSSYCIWIFTHYYAIINIEDKDGILAEEDTRMNLLLLKPSFS